MGTSTYDRVRKHRDKKKSTIKGIDELRAKNREYAARSRAKKEMKRLLDEKTSLKSSLSFSEQKDVDNKVQAYNANNLQKWNILGDAKIVVDLKVLRYEVQILRKVAKKDLIEIAGVLLNLRSNDTPI